VQTIATAVKHIIEHVAIPRASPLTPRVSLNAQPYCHDDHESGSRFQHGYHNADNFRG
jgi:hypothetical protein